MSELDHVLAAVDLGESSEPVVNFAATLARVSGAELIALHVISPEEQEDRAQNPGESRFVDVMISDAERALRGLVAASGTEDLVVRCIAEYFSFPETEIWPKPVQKPYPPIWTGGHGPTAMDITAEFSTGWIPPWIPPEEYPERIRSLDELAVEKGWGGTEFDIATEVYVSLAETRDEAISSAEKTLGVLTEGFDHTATQDSIAAAGLIGSADDIGEKIGKYVEAGVNHYEMKFIYHTVDHLLEQLEHFASAVTPAFR